MDVALPLSRARPDRVTRSNGYRHRDLDTRVGAIGVVPEPRQGGYVSDRLLRAPQARRDRPDHCRRRLPPRWRVQAPHGSPDAHCAHIASGPRLVRTPGISFPSKSRVSRTATRLDEHVRPAPPPPPGQGRAGARGTWSQSNHIRRGSNRARPAGSRGSNEEWPPSVTAATGWSGWRDLNPRPLRPERSALPNCATPRVQRRQHSRAGRGGGNLPEEASVTWPAAPHPTVTWKPANPPGPAPVPGDAPAPAVNPRDRRVTRENVCQGCVLAGQAAISAVTRRSRGLSDVLAEVRRSARG